MVSPATNSADTPATGPAPTHASAHPIKRDGRRILLDVLLLLGGYFLWPVYLVVGLLTTL